MSDDEYGNEDTGGFGDGDFNEYNEDALNDLEENEFAEVLSSHMLHEIFLLCLISSFSTSFSTHHIDILLTYTHTHTRIYIYIYIYIHQYTSMHFRGTKTTRMNTIQWTK